MLKHLAIDLGNTNTLVASLDQSGNKKLIHLPRISQIDAQLTSDPERPFTLVPSEVFHADHGPEVGARAWANLQKDETPEAYKRYSRNFKRQLLQSFVEARHDEEGHRSILQSSTDFVRLFCEELRRELQVEFGSIEVPSLLLTAPVEATAEYRAWLRETFATYLEPHSIGLLDESTAAALFHGVETFGSRILIIDVGGSTTDITLADIGFAGDGTPVEAQLIAKAGGIIGGSTIDDILAIQAFALQGLNAPATYNKKSYLQAIRAAEKVKKKLSFRSLANEPYEDLQTGLTINMRFRSREFNELINQSSVVSSLHGLIRRFIEQLQHRQIDLGTINGAIMVGGCTVCPPVRQALEEALSEFRITLAQSESQEQRFCAVVFGALAAPDAPVRNDYLLHDYALRLKADNGNSVYRTLFRKGTVYPCISDYQLHTSRRSADQTGIRISVGELYKQPRLAHGDGASSSEQVPLVASDFRPLGTGGHLIVIPVDASARLGEKRYRVTFAIDADRQLRINVDDTVTNRRIFDNHIVSDLSNAPPAPLQHNEPPHPPPTGIQRVVELNPHPSYNSLELEVSSVIKDVNLGGFLISNVILGHHLHEVDHLLFSNSGQIYIIESKNYKGTWSGGINSVWICTGPDGVERTITARPVNPMLQCRRYISDVMRRVQDQYPDVTFSKACLVVAPDGAELAGISGCGNNLMNVSSLPAFIAAMEQRRQERPRIDLAPERLRQAFYLA